MQTRIHKLDKWKHTPESFEKLVNSWIESVGDVELISVSENLYTGDLVFVFVNHGEKKSINQELCLIAWSSLELLEGAVNNALAGIEEQGLRGSDIHIITTAKSARAAAAFLVEGNRPHLATPELSDRDDAKPETSEEYDRKQDGAKETKQDETANVKPKRKRKSKSVA